MGQCAAVANWYPSAVNVEGGWEYGGPHAGHLVGDFPHASNWTISGMPPF
jgi:hypothetical protein